MFGLETIHGIVYHSTSTEGSGKVYIGEHPVIKIDVQQGDITRIEADALVNAANNHLWMGGGVAGALKRAGGPEVEDEVMAKGPVPVGEAVAGTAGRLPASYIIHAAVMGQDLTTDSEKIRRATRNSLLRADELVIKTIAFPALGTGVGGFPLGECARVMIDEVMQHLSGETGLEMVIFVLFDEPAYRVFRQELDSRTGQQETS
jgi:O-acetyl-ADP-ribose deacetylase (regulator of RNase III)